MFHKVLKQNLVFGEREVLNTQKVSFNILRKLKFDFGVRKFLSLKEVPISTLEESKT